LNLQAVVEYGSVDFVYDRKYRSRIRMSHQIDRVVPSSDVGVKRRSTVLELSGISLVSS
jgi:hypothetical protein